MHLKDKIKTGFIISTIILMISACGQLDQNTNGESDNSDTIISGYSQTGEEYMTGLPELTTEELEWQNKHMLRVKKVHLNKMGLARINEARRKKGLAELDEVRAGVKQHGQELETIVGEAENTSIYTNSLPGAELPGSVDNSTLKYFPPIRSQGSIPSCGCYSGTYYTMTYMYALANDLDAKNGGTQYQLTPKWTYNMVNGGAAVGSWYYWAYDIGIKHGVATMEEFPYDSNIREWCLNPDVWQNAVNRKFDQYGYVSSTDTEAGMEQIKQMLVNGYLLNISVYINSFQWKTIANDPNTTLDDAAAGKRIVFYVNGTEGYHAMTVVGYNDDIWTDINGNGVVDTGEKGAFRIANSWGTGWNEAGYCWMAYDALKGVSAVEGGPSSGRISGWAPTRAHWVTAKTNYQPKALAQFTVNHAYRNQLSIDLGVSDTTLSAPSTVWYSEMINYQGGAYAFDGTSIAVDGTFIFDLTDIIDTSDATKKYYLQVRDSAAGNPATIKSFFIIDLVNNVAVSDNEMPQSVDGSVENYAISYSFFDGNLGPIGMISASTVSGLAPLLVELDATGSYDPDGTIVSYAWDFGDGSAAAPGINVSHTYTTPGTYKAVLTVTDDGGATSSTEVSIKATTITIAAPSSLTAAVNENEVTLTWTDNSDHEEGFYIEQGSMRNKVKPDMSSLRVIGTTGQDTCIYIDTKEPGNYYYRVKAFSTTLGKESDYSAGTIVSVTSTGPTNSEPVARISASTLSGLAPLLVELDATGSYDPDGTIVSYAWDFGDGSAPAPGISVSHTYITPGTYKAVLTVTDNDGATSSTEVVIEADSTIVETIDSPSGLTAVVNGSEVTLTWIDNASNEEGFYIEQGLMRNKVKPNLSSMRVIGTTRQDTCMYIDTKEPGNYYYRVKAYSSTLGNESDYSNGIIVSVTATNTSDNKTNNRKK